MANDFKYDVFLSHSSKDKSVVRPLAERLSASTMRKLRTRRCDLPRLTEAGFMGSLFAQDNLFS
jgi:hypothetical protein